MRHLSILISFIIFFSCNQTENKDFEARSDCRVYNNEVIIESYPFGKVAFIDTTNASGCLKEQLKNVYLLYYDAICVAVYNQNPKTNIKTIEFFIKKYQSDTTRLSDFVQSDSSISLTVDRLCKDKNDNVYYGNYVSWKDIEYSTLTKPYQNTKDKVLQTWYKWTE